MQIFNVNFDPFILLGICIFIFIIIVKQKSKYDSHTHTHTYIHALKETQKQQEKKKQQQKQKQQQKEKEKQLPSNFEDFIGPETLNREYKEFTFNLTGLGYDYKESIGLCESNSFEFNSQVISNVEKYFESYVPKNIVAFYNHVSNKIYQSSLNDSNYLVNSDDSNNPINVEGEMYIGISDDGFILGIPYQGELPIDMLTSRFYKYLEKNVSKSAFKGNLQDFVKVNFIKLDFPIAKLSEYKGQSHPDYSKYLESKAEYDRIKQIKTEAYEDWKIRYSFFQRKLVVLLNSPESRILLIKFIQEREPTNPIIQLLESGKLVEDIPAHEITKVVVDKTNPYYWASSYKDYMEEVLRLQRPKPSRTEFPESSTPFNLLNSVSKMIPYWLANNSEMNLYMIQIVYTFDPISMSKLPKWTCFDDKIGKLCSLTRTIKPDGSPENIRDEIFE